MNNKYYSDDEILEKYRGLISNSKQSVSRYLNIVSQLQEDGFVICEEGDLEKATRHHCSEIPCCSFCGRKIDSAVTFFSGDDVLICEGCIRVMADVLKDKEKDVVWATAAVERYSEMMRLYSDDYKSEPRGVFDGYNLRYAFLWRAVLRGASLQQADLEGARLMDADLRNVDFSGASLVNANFHGAKLNHAILLGANLAGANFSGADLSDAIIDQPTDTDKM